MATYVCAAAAAEQSATHPHQQAYDALMAELAYCRALCAGYLHVSDFTPAPDLWDDAEVRQVVDHVLWTLAVVENELREVG